MPAFRATAILAALALLAAPGPASAGEASPALESVLSMPVDGTIIIEPDGAVGEYALTSQLTPGVKAMLDKTIPKWRFEPVVIDGAARRAQTRVRIVLAANEVEGGFKVRIDNVVFPAPTGAIEETPQLVSQVVDLKGKKMQPPRYPIGLMVAGISGRVLLGLRFGRDGVLVDAVAVQSMLFNVKGSERNLAKAIGLLETSAMDAARHWSADVSVKRGATPTPRDFTVYTTIEYMLDRPGHKQSSGDPPPGTWRLVIRTPKRDMPWLAGDKLVPVVGVADLTGGEMLPVAGAPQLMTPVVGTIL